MAPLTRNLNALQKQRSQTIKYLTEDEVKRLFSVIESKRDRALFLI